ncbi:MAG: hypothetical protein HY821_09375 [Acidobacteria bacterium]|nr:hypothetical protein [Acidobacteriota bacterium]
MKSLGPAQPDARLALRRLAEAVKVPGKAADCQRIEESLAGLPVYPCKMRQPPR